ncbi:5-hydroxyisourate hydrolase [Parastagonospora nodorum SN15]|uniref:5-hydroxyisourate hydrolase n=1 Tax=Phaeosphaeria nodorum (strain SN15 / ATCC MYA-4574 / FGSC 10173) TaxID=321614 RepID=A0A7U2EZM6_PHANO|nr:5-hydroxyisourate hydrolase [Parastagonospora nodorum SN15]
MATEKKPPITCHVLDTTIGKPGANIPPPLLPFLHLHPAILPIHHKLRRPRSLLDPTPPPFTAPTPLETLFHQPGDQRWSLTFNTEEYFKGRGVETFFPEIEVKFVVREAQKGEHFHVPVLVGGFGYSTYRGS